MQNMSENESCCESAMCCTAGFFCGPTIGGLTGYIYSGVTSASIESLMTNLAVGTGLGATAGLLLVVMFLIDKKCRAHNNAVDIEQPKEDTNLLPAQGNQNNETKNLCKQSGQPGSSSASLFSTTPTVESANKSANNLNDTTHNVYQI